MSVARHQSRPPRVAGRSKRSASGLLWWAGVVALPFAAALSPFTTMVAAVGLAPAIVAWITSAPAQRYGAISIACLSLAGVVPVGWSLLQAGGSATVAARYLGDPFIWLAMYSPAAVGWVIYLTVPPIHEMLFARRLERRRRTLKRHQKRLLQEWGAQADPAHGSPQAGVSPTEAVS